VNGRGAFGLLRALLCGGALFALLAHALLLGGVAVSRWWLPLCVLGGGGALFVLARRRAPVGEPEANDGNAPSPRWLQLLLFAVVALCAAALAYGAMATSDRAWDGAVAWGIKAVALTAQTEVQQPYFADPAVFQHSPGYPLLQPLCIASLAQWVGAAPARLLFPLLYVLLTALVGLAVRQHTKSGRAGCWAALAVAVTPVFVNTSGGSFDSGYAEGFFALALAAAAAGLLLRDAALLAAAAVVLPLLKPEGSVHLLAVVAACFLATNKTLLAASLVGGTTALLVWLPLQLQLGYHAPAGWLLPLATIAVAAVAFASRCALDRGGAGPRGRALLVAGATVLAVVALLAARPWLADHRGALLGQYLGSLERVLDKLPHVPAIVGGLLKQALLPNRFGFTFVLLLALPFVLGRRLANGPVGTVVLLLGLGLCAVFGAFLLSPEADVQHHLRSSAGRLLSHWVGVAWLVIGAVTPGLVRSIPWRTGADAFQSASANPPPAAGR